MPAGVSCTRGGGLPAQGSADERLDHDGAQGGEVDVRGELGAVAGGPRRGEHRVRERAPTPRGCAGRTGRPHPCTSCRHTTDSP